MASNLQPDAGADIGGIERLRRENFETILDRIELHKPVASARFLEVGCAQGWFLTAVMQRGGKICGIEPDQVNAAIAQRTGAPVTIGFFPEDLTAGEQHDVIAFNDVFEHLPQPAAIARSCEALLGPAGLVVINLPTSDGFFYRLASIMDRAGVHAPFERLWQKGLQSPHVSYFNSDNLQQLIETHTSLVQVGKFPLRSLSRTGLYARICSTYSGLTAPFIFAGVWILSFIVPAMPSDITVGIFQKPIET